jgi:diguanylate cyclase (GGDEF)-like protein/excisionase family DNA binding protein
MALDPGKDWLTIAEAALVLGVSKSTLYRWHNEGRLAFYRFGPRTVRVRRVDLLALPETERSVAGSALHPFPELLRGQPMQPGVPADRFVVENEVPVDTISVTHFPRTSMELLAQALGTAVTWNELAKSVASGLYTTFVMNVAVLALRSTRSAVLDLPTFGAMAKVESTCTPVREPADPTTGYLSGPILRSRKGKSNAGRVFFDQEAEGLCDKNRETAWALALPHNWLGKRHSTTEIIQLPYVAAVLKRIAHQEETHKVAGGIIGEAASAILSLPGKVALTMRHKPPQLMAITSFRGRACRGMLAIADWHEEMGEAEAYHMLQLWGMIMAQAADNLWRLHYESLAFTDPLTGLGNRRLFEYTISRELARTQRYRHPMSLILMDLDAFRQINEVHGHPGGDKALQEIGAWLATKIRRTDLIARVGGDEFGIILVETGKAGASKLAQRLINGLQKVPVIDDSHVSASAGIAEACDEDLTVSELYRRADVALYAAKRAGGGTWRVYSAEMDSA